VDHSLFIVLVGVAVFAVAAAAQAVTGFGSALVGVPLLAVVVDPVAAVVSVTAVAFVMTLGAVRRERSHVEGPALRRFALWGLVGLPIGLAALRLLPPARLTLVMAIVLLVLGGLLAVGVRLPAGRVAQRVAGVTSGALLASTGMNGPPIVVMFQAMGMTPRRFRATLQGVFCIQDLLAVVGFVLVGSFSRTALLLVLGGMAGMPLGWVIGDRAFHLLSPVVFRRVVLGMLAVTALVAGAKALA
jgi:hypothetical protein